MSLNALKESTSIRITDRGRSWRIGDWKIVAAGRASEWELYDLKSDRTESRNVAAQHPETVHELSAIWQKQSDEYAAEAKKDLAPKR